MRMRKPKGGIIELMNLRPAFNQFKRLDYGRDSLPDNACLYFWLSLFNFICILQVLVFFAVLPSYALEEVVGVRYFEYIVGYIPGILYLGMVAGILIGSMLVYAVPVLLVGVILIVLGENTSIPDNKYTSGMGLWMSRFFASVHNIYKRICPELTDE